MCSESLWLRKEKGLRTTAIFTEPLLKTRGLAAFSFLLKPGLLKMSFIA